MLVRVLGTVQIADTPAGPAKQSCVLAVLALEHGRPVSIESLIDRVWGDQPPRSPRDALYQYLSRLRGLGLAVRRPGPGYLREGAAEQTALHVPRSPAGHARTAAARGDVAAATRHYRQALDLWTGFPLAGIDGDWAATVRETLVREHLTLLGERFDAELAQGRHTQILAELSAVAAAHPLAERLGGQLMLALFRCGQAAEALQYFAQLRQRIRDQLGAEPSAALHDLHRRILQQDPTLARDHEQTSDAAPPSPGTGLHEAPRQLPADLPAFAGRRRELAAMDTMMRTATHQSRAVVITAVSGTAGVGKTALALHWAHRVADQFPDGQLYVNLRGFDASVHPMSAAEAVRGFLDAFGVPAERIPSTLDAQAALYRSLLAGRRVLVVLDNARDADQVRPLLPGTARAMAVVTSRNQLTSLVAIHGAHPLSLDLLSTAEAHELLVRRLGAARVAEEPEAVQAIIAGCDRLPLALSIAAGRAHQAGFSLAVLAAELSKAADSERLNALDAGDAISQVRAVFSWSYHRLRPAAARLFCLLCQQPGPDISVAAAVSLAGEPAGQVHQSLTELVGTSLLAEHQPGRYIFHDLVRAYANDLAQANLPEDHLRAAATRMLDHYLHTAYAADRVLYSYRDPITLFATQTGVQPEDLPDRSAALAWLNTEHRVLLAVIGQAAGLGFDTHCWQLAQILTEFFHRRGHWHDWVASQHVALDAARHLADPVLQGFTHRTLSRAYARLGRHDDADRHLREALALFNESGDPIDLAHTHRGLAWILERRGRFEQALTHLEEAYHLFEIAGHNVGQGNTLNAIGWHHAQRGDQHQAIEYCEQALAIQQKAGDRHGEAATWDSLGYAHHHLANHDGAAHCYERALTLRRNLGDRYDEANTLAHLGDTYSAAGNPTKARRAWQQAVHILDELGHPETETVRAKLYGQPDRSMPSRPPA
ncbi:tetratricopeptide repeat protein [Micromonospora sp. CPCC 205371]|nr:tetratricopeptide repeat protein [Micromonospora sp. CPCC 205371]